VRRSPAPALSRLQPVSRREELLAVAARLFADRGFTGVTMDDIGAAAGISGPALYHHFASKESMLGEMLVSISEHLHAQGAAIVAAGSPPATTLERLVDAHVGFAVDHPELITVHFRDLVRAPATDQRRVRTRQARYVDMWVGVLQAATVVTDERTTRAAVHAAFGLINSTPQIRPARDLPTAALLRSMALGAFHRLGEQ